MANVPVPQDSILLGLEFVLHVILRAILASDHCLQIVLHAILLARIEIMEELHVHVVMATMMQV